MLRVTVVTLVENARAMSEEFDYNCVTPIEEVELITVAATKLRS